MKAGLVNFPDISGNGVPQCAQGIPLLNIGKLDGISSHGYLDLVVGGDLSGNKVSAVRIAKINVDGCDRYAGYA